MPGLIAVLKDAKLNLVHEVEVQLEKFPDMIELAEVGYEAEPCRQFFRIGITDRRALYREGVSYRISQ